MEKKMKNQKLLMVSLILIFAVLFSLAPQNAALAKKDDTVVDLKVRNRTGGIVEIKLVDENGNPSWFRYEPGQTITPLSEGIYAYYASTDCGNRSGVFNLNVTKELLFSCGNGIEVTLTVPTGSSFCYSVFDYNENYVWGLIGTYCQPGRAQEGDWINFYNPYWGDNLPHYYELNGNECYQAGNGYYYKPCPSKPQ
jgi:hypothetical protein